MVTDWPRLRSPVHVMAVAVELRLPEVATASALYWASSSTPERSSVITAPVKSDSPVFVATIVYASGPPATTSARSAVLVMLSAGTRTVTVELHPASLPVMQPAYWADEVTSSRRVRSP